MKVVVIGGRGFLGSRAVAALARVPGVEVHVAGRAGPLRVDLRDPGTFAALAGADVVVDFASTAQTPPDALADWCVAHGVVMLEGSSERAVVEGLHAHLTAREGRGEPGGGAVVLGAGIFTGVSNLMGRAAAAAVPACRALAFAAGSSPYSGAGKGTVDLMGSALATPALAYEGGAARLGPPASAGPALPFARGERTTIAVPLPEAYMLHASLGVPDVRVYLAPRPHWLRALYLMLPVWLLRSGFFRAYMRGVFAVLRRGLLARTPSAVELVAVATGTGGERAVVTVDTRDGMAAGGAAVAAMVAQLADGSATMRPGSDGRRVVFADEVFALRATVARANEYAESEAARMVVGGAAAG